MHNKRIKILVILSALLLLICLLSLTKIQLLSGSYYLEKIAEFYNDETWYGDLLEEIGFYYAELTTYDDAGFDTDDEEELKERLISYLAAHKALKYSTPEFEDLEDDLLTQELFNTICNDSK